MVREDLNEGYHHNGGEHSHHQGTQHRRSNPVQVEAHLQKVTQFQVDRKAASLAG